MITLPQSIGEEDVNLTVYDFKYGTFIVAFILKPCDFIWIRSTDQKRIKNKDE